MYDLEHYEEIGAPYRKRQKRKLRAFLTSSILTAVFVGGVCLGVHISREEKDRKF